MDRSLRVDARNRGVRRLASLSLVAALGACSPAADAPLPEAAPAAPERLAVERSSVDVDRMLNAAFLVVDGVYNSELMAPYDILQHTIFHTPKHNDAPGIETFVVSPDGEDVITFEGLRVGAHHSFETAPPIDILIVPSAEHSMDSDLENEELISWVKEVGGNASFVVSLCDGAFVLAQAGLLDDKAATTFPGDQDRFAATFPKVDLRRGVSFVQDGRMLTSEGGAKSYDVAMYLVDHLYGLDTARGVAGGLIIDWPLPADQALVADVGSTEASG
ncbi:MAG: DJ-1/PfpI family protein [Acidobacteriota bacterium]